MGPADGALMNISVKGEYALHALFDLACRSNAEPVKIAEIAKRQKIPQKFLELILAGLKQGGFVESRRGADGGYLLARPAESITIGEVLRYIEGGRGGRSSGRGAESAAFSEVWKRADEAISGVLDHTSFADVVRSWRERQQRYVPNWDI
jgi:Rrf2 family protein